MQSTRLSFLVSSVLALSLAFAPSSFAEHPGHAALAAADSLPTAAGADAALRDLWVEHVFWVRNVVVATLAPNPDEAAVAEGEVVANAHAIAAAIEPYYGKEAAGKLFTLLAGHYGAVKAILGEFAKGATEPSAVAMKALTDNATEIARFLSSANPNLPFDAVNGLLLAHGAHHIQEIGQLKDRNYAGEARTWADMRKHMFAIADALAGAIARQFPEKFR